MQRLQYFRKVLFFYQDDININQRRDGSRIEPVLRTGGMAILEIFRGKQRL
jgi:hypothetical protein